MNIIKNPARCRPLSANVRRLMRMSRESPENPDVKRVEREFKERDRIYCDTQGKIFMAALDKNVSMSDFAPLYMTSQFAGVMDHSFSVTGRMEDDDISALLQVPILMKSPETIVDVVIWLNNIIVNKQKEEPGSLAVIKALNDDSEPAVDDADDGNDDPIFTANVDIDTMTDEYEYAYWLGYIYRYECLLHDESSRMVYGAFSEKFMRETYEQMIANGAGDSIILKDCAGEMCKRLDSLLIGKLWK